ncbi:MAG: response regulator [Lachnospiraceae bacterium]|nr:response regulator [Lachnospiraceae bacterium]
MNYIIVDDEPFALEDLEEALCAAAPDAVLHGFTSPKKALEYAEKSPVDAAFLDIELGSTSGLVLAKQLKDIQPDIHIIFVTSHEQYALKAFQLHATGYLMKPATQEDIRRELTFLYGEQGETRRLRVQTFGGFDVFSDGKPLLFKRAKAKELLAYLIDRRGSSVTTGEACAVLWEGAADDAGQKSYFRTLVTDLRSTLRLAGAEDVLVKGFNRLAIDPTRLDCDSYRFQEGDPQAINRYRRDYLPNYSWAEFTMGMFEARL